MRIGIQTWGSDGDINPFLALAGGLVAAGHDVTLALTSAERKDYGGPARRLGFRLADAGHIGRDEADLVEIARRVHDEASPLRQLDLILEEMFEPGVGRMLEVAERLCRDNDLVIGHFIVHPAQAVAERAGRPYVTVTLNHSAIPSRHLPLMGTPHLGPFLNGLLWRLGQRILSLHIVPPINRLRSRLGLRAVSSYREVWESRLANLIAVSPSLCRRPPDWEPHQRVCGFFAMPEAAQPFEMPHALEGFLAGGPPPIFCTFGSMTAVDDGTGIMEESTRLLVEGARLAGCRAIVQSRWDLVSSVPDDSGLYKIGAAPHSRILPRCAAVVHHGGAGTTQTATLHGLPSVVVPHISDQYLGAGVEPPWSRPSGGGSKEDHRPRTGGGDSKRAAQRRHAREGAGTGEGHGRRRRGRHGRRGDRAGHVRSEPPLTHCPAVPPAQRLHPAAHPVEAFPSRLPVTAPQVHRGIGPSGP